MMTTKYGPNYPSPGGRTGGPIPTTGKSRRSHSAPPSKRNTEGGRKLFSSPSRSANNKKPKGKWGRPPVFGKIETTGPKGNKGNTGPKGNKGNTGPKGNMGFTGLKGNMGFTGLKGNKGNKGPKGSPAPAPAQVIPAKSITTRYKQLKEKLKAIQNLASNRSRRSENNARELRQLIRSQQNNLLRQIRQRNTRMHRYSRIRGYPTNYYSPNTFSRYYRMPPVHRGLSQYYYYERPGVPRYVQQLPPQVWRINQGGRGLPPVPFYPTRRRQVRRARR